MPTQQQLISVSQIVADTRATAQHTLDGFASELGVSRQAVSLWEQGQSEPDYERIIGWLRDPRPWVHLLGANVARAKYAELFEHIHFTLTPEIGA